ncbi:Thrombospondin-type laminin G domain and EAR repeat-containing protein-like protein [Hapsidospora chrysogenum ATCC 11550]|uniref:Thrombospondin-type laminin G domain and EAR repeat-containing protein-like protein n=1 Tax=Hapsidospora chrysogenum (strain ATCC 11550 / CBS 779.69 / DSM 880 / IAM 14645 / JCM 23072 / IMI 49137) TaxID=857340 RepID=A0A086SY12_HAPC1|nr:Thrombospondin-type laminin G domain and EAR repeat-containing protein-like protein [Hapsidospora chrysogenum ATCC 11550]
MLELSQSLYTSGARAASLLDIQASPMLAIPQLAQDIPGGAPGMHGGDSDITLMLYRTDQGSSQFHEIQQLDVPGGEDAEFVTVDDRTFLATASIRSGSDPHFDPNVDSVIFEWDGEKMVEFQRIPTWGAKQWRSFQIDGRHLLALAQGHGDMVDESPVGNISTSSTIFEWDGQAFQPFQTVASHMGYNWLYFSVDGHDFLAYADHAELSTILEWVNGEFVPFQKLDGPGGRAFCLLESRGETFLAFSRITSDSLVYKWDGTSFQHHQTLEGAGGREFALVTGDDGSSYLVHVKFLTGSLEDPITAMDSVIYRLTDEGLLVQVDTFLTHGATDVSTFSVDGQSYLVTAESLTEDLRFRQDSHVYAFVPGELPVLGKRQETDGAYVSPQFMSLFRVYTGDGAAGTTSIGAQYRNGFTELQSSNPLIVASSDAILLYPGDGRDPAYLNYRYGVAGFIELTAVSHLAPAVASLAEIAGFTPNSTVWRASAEALLNATKAAKGANSESLWREKLAVETYKGREDATASMIDYACALTIRLLNTVLAEPEKLTAGWIRKNYLDATEDELGASVPMNHIMMATFFLGALDSAMQTRNAFEPHDIDWKRAMVLINGQVGRETAGVVMRTNTLAQMLLKSNPELPVERVYIVPQGTVPNVTADSSAEELRAYEPEMRKLWGRHRSYVELSRKMFEGYPAYKVDEGLLPVIDDETEFLSDLPAIGGPDDWLALTTRLRVTLEDPRQPLSGSVADYATRELYEAGWDVSKVVVPGLDGYDYGSALKEPLA